MKVIFIRHGQTSENVAHRHQPTDTSLSVVGRKQAVVAGERLADAGITHIVASPLVRTLQTASLIADQLDMIPSIDHMLVELVRPRSVTGYSHSHPRSLLFFAQWYLGLTREGESYVEIRERIAQAKVHIERLPTDATILVVSHSVFMSLFLAHVCSPRGLTPWGAVHTFIKLKRLKNTEMIEYAVSPGENLCGWVRATDLQLS